VSLSTRILPREEYERLKGTEVESVAAQLPDTARVVVVEREGRIVGTWTLLPIVHAECVWIAEDERGRGSVARRLLAGLSATAREVFGVGRVWTAARDEDTRTQDLIAALRGELVPGRHYVMPLPSARRESPCPQL
jgi:hypothetical protein